MPSCPPTTLRGSAEVLADVVDVQCVGKSGGYVAYLKITKVLSGKISEKSLALNFARGADRPASGVAFLKGDKERLKLHLCDKSWVLLSSNDRTVLLASAGMLPVCK
jgi:hypothetical protein